ncbi:MAG: PA14 domain-containing protein [Anaerolineae bacterium]
MPRRRTLTRLTWAVIALALGWLAQGLLQENWLWEGLLLYAAAAVLFARQLRQAPPTRTAAAASPEEGALLPSRYYDRTAAKSFVYRLSFGIVGVCVALSLMALIHFSRLEHTTGWMYYLASWGIFILGIRLATWSGKDARSHCCVSDSQPGRLRMDIWLLVILAIALFFRTYRFHSVPFGVWYDEAVAGIEARLVWDDPTFRPLFWESMNHPAHHLYLFALSLRLFGDTIWALRAVSVAFGMGTVLAAYLFGRALYGRRWGLLLAFLVATARWDVNFSRVAMNSIEVPFFAFLTLFCAVRAWRSQLQSPGWMAATGLALGLGLCFHTAFRLFAAAFSLFGGVLLILQAKRRSEIEETGSSHLTSHQSISRTLPGIYPSALFLVAVWLATAPVVQFAMTHPTIFWQRTRTVAIFTNRENPDLAAALLNNIRKHALMFNYRGDPNGRHNLPGAPTLDRLSGVLFVLGLALAIARRDRVSRFFLLLFPFGLAGGIFSLDFEAPQSLRSIAALPAVLYFIALSLDALWSELRWSAAITRPRWSWIIAALGLGIITVENAQMYFLRQANDIAVWQSFSTPETLIGMKVAELGTWPVYYFSPLLYDHPTIRFLAPERVSANGFPSVRKIMALPDPLPAREAGDRPVIYFVHPDEAWVVSLARQLYPNARIVELPGEPGYPVVTTMIVLQPEEVHSVQGLEMRYWHDNDTHQPPLKLERWLTIDGHWPEDAPLELPFSGELNGVLYAPRYGRYQLAIEVPGRASLTLDDQQWAITRTLSLELLLAQGNHSVRLWMEGDHGRVHLAWKSPGDTSLQTVPQQALYKMPVSAHGLLGRYFANPNFSGDPVFERIDPRLDVYFHLTPLPRPYSVEWSGAIEIPYEGTYTFGVRAVDAAELYLDDQLVVRTQVPDQLSENVLFLQSGLHTLRLTFRDLTTRSRIHLYWKRPGGEREIIPTPYLWPSMISARLAPPPPPITRKADVWPPLELIWLTTWGSAGEGPGQFNEPRDVAVIGDKVYVADTGNRRVQVFDREGHFQAAWEGGEERFAEPLALGVNDRGELLVLDSLPGWIYRFTPEGGSLGRIAGPEAAFFHPRGMTVLPDGTIIVADTGGARLVFLNEAGILISQLGGYGTAPGEFHEPTDVLRDEQGNYYVLEAYNQRMQHVDRWGGSLGIWPIPPSIAYDGPHMAWAPDGSLLVTAPGEGSVLRYTPDGQLLGGWDQAGGGAMQRPVGIYIDEHNVVYITDTLNHQVYLFKLHQAP